MVITVQKGKFKWLTCTYMNKIVININLYFTFVKTLGVPLILRAENIPSKPEQRSCCVGKSKADISYRFGVFRFQNSTAFLG